MNDIAKKLLWSSYFLDDMHIPVHKHITLRCNNKLAIQSIKKRNIVKNQGTSMFIFILYEME